MHISDDDPSRAGAKGPDAAQQAGVDYMSLPVRAAALAGPLASVEIIVDLAQRAEDESVHRDAEGDPATAKRLHDAAAWLRLVASAHPSRPDAVLLADAEWPAAIEAASWLGQFFADKPHGAT